MKTFYANFTAEVRISERRAYCFQSRSRCSIEPNETEESEE